MDLLGPVIWIFVRSLLQTASGPILLRFTQTGGDLYAFTVN